jgi:hypothetical protein
MVLGTWTAQPGADTMVSLKVSADDKFTWRVIKGKESQQFTGSSTYGGGILTLVQENGPVLVGGINWTDANHMTFRVAGEGPEDPGLSFSR